MYVTAVTPAAQIPEYNRSVHVEEKAMFTVYSAELGRAINFETLKEAQALVKGLHRDGYKDAVLTETSDLDRAGTRIHRV
jgi:hypothetical protein